MKAVLALLGLVCIYTLSCGSSTTPTPVPAQNPALTPLRVIELSAARMVALKTVSFTLDHEDGASTELFSGIQIERVEGRVQLPDSFDISIEATIALLGGLGSYVNIGLVAVADQVLMTNPLVPGEWNPVPLSTLPFSFVDLGRTLGDLIGSVQNPTYSGTEEVDDVPSWRIQGTVPSEALGALIPSAVAGQEVEVEVWIGQPQNFLRRVRIGGQILAGDNPEVVRVLSLQGFNQPVEISLP